MFQSDIKNVQKFLDSKGDRYLSTINGTTREYFNMRVKELSLLTKYVPCPKKIVSLGVGEGEEIEVLNQIYKVSKPEIIGVDISLVAIESAKKRVEKSAINTSFMVASATDLPIDSDTVDLVVCSSLLHEIFSYLPGNKDSWNKALRETVRILKEDGCLFIKDPAAPKGLGRIEITFLTEMARQFYDYFRAEFRVLSSWTEEARYKITLRRQKNEDNFPEINEGRIILSAIQAAELMLHFRNFWKDSQKGLTHIGDIFWKEIDEIYYPSFTDQINKKVMSYELYVDEIIRQGNLELSGTPYEFVCVRKELSPRVGLENTVGQHFSLCDMNNNIKQRNGGNKIISLVTNKMELVFKKVRKDNH